MPTDTVGLTVFLALLTNAICLGLHVLARQFSTGIIKSATRHSVAYSTFLTGLVFVWAASTIDAQEVPFIICGFGLIMSIMGLAAIAKLHPNKR